VLLQEDTLNRWWGCCCALSRFYMATALYIVGGVDLAPVLGNIRLQGTLHRRGVGVAPLLGNIR